MKRYLWLKGKTDPHKCHEEIKLENKAFCSGLKRKMESLGSNNVTEQDVCVHIYNKNNNLLDSEFNLYYKFCNGIWFWGGAAKGLPCQVKV